MFRIAFGFLVGIAAAFWAFAASAEQVQIQLTGNVPKVFEADLVWEEASTPNCPTSCRVATKRIKIKLGTSGMGLYNVDVIAPATRLCLNGIAGPSLILDSVLIKANGRKFVTDRKGGNIESNGRSGCSFPQTTLADAIIWKVNLE